jgi:hypothetical protein
VGNSRGGLLEAQDAHVMQVIVRRGPKNLIYISGNRLARITTRLGGGRFQIRNIGCLACIDAQREIEGIPRKKFSGVWFD